jgi:hypothetical protein
VASAATLKELPKINAEIASYVLLKRLKAVTLKSEAILKAMMTSAYWHKPLIRCLMD